MMEDYNSILYSITAGYAQSLAPKAQVFCPSCPVKYTCVMIRALQTSWVFFGDLCPNKGNRIGLIQTSTSSGSCSEDSDTCGPFTVMHTAEQTDGACLTSILTATASAELDALSFECVANDVDGNVTATAGKAVILLAGLKFKTPVNTIFFKNIDLPVVPVFKSLVCTPVNMTSVTVAIGWGDPQDDTIDSYTLTAQGPVGDCTPESPCQLTSLERERDFVLEFGESYAFTVSATNCQSSSCGEAQSSEDAEITVNLLAPGKMLCCLKIIHMIT